MQVVYNKIRIKLTCCVHVLSAFFATFLTKTNFTSFLKIPYTVPTLMKCIFKNIAVKWFIFNSFNSLLRSIIGLQGFCLLHTPKQQR